MPEIQYLGNDEFKITRAELESLLHSYHTLNALEDGGVDNWNYHWESQEEYINGYAEDHKGMEFDDEEYPEMSDVVNHNMKLLEGTVGE